MHGLDIIKALNKHATEKCANCNTARINVEARSPRDFLRDYEVDGRTVRLCGACVREEK